MSKVQKIVILTSGGDAQGMNACIRSIARVAIASNIKVLGSVDGFNGLIDNNIINISYTDVSNIIQRGGTILGTARSSRFLEKTYREKAYKNIVKNHIDAIVIIGGDGSYKGVKIFNEEFKIPYIGIPGTIDNDIIGTDYTIGFDTALNNIISTIDKIKDTASSHHRIFLIEVMGNTSGNLAIKAALATGAEEVFIPETEEDYPRFELKIKAAMAHNKSSIVIVSEGDELGGAQALHQYLKSKKLHEKVRISILGHMQRGGAPSFRDREVGSLFGAKSIELLINNKFNLLLGLNNGHIVSYTFTDQITKHNQADQNYLDLINVLSVY